MPRKLPLSSVTLRDLDLEATLNVVSSGHPLTLINTHRLQKNTIEIKKPHWGESERIICRLQQNMT